jgi:alkylhydroperoxidase family enzyme
MSEPRLAPIEPPFPDWFADAMAKTMPPGAPPLALFTTIARSERAWRKFSAGSLLDRGPLSLRQRELVINRTTAKTGCEYEWGVHVAAFAAKVGFGPREIAATVHGPADAECWSAEEQAIVAAVDALLETKRLSADGYGRLAQALPAEAILEIVQLVAFYHGVALICGTFAIPLEPGAPRFPAAS